jgi:hypothetical protein
MNCEGMALASRLHPSEEIDNRQGASLSKNEGDGAIVAVKQMSNGPET